MGTAEAQQRKRIDSCEEQDERRERYRRSERSLGCRSRRSRACHAGGRMAFRVAPDLRDRILFSRRLPRELLSSSCSWICGRGTDLQGLFLEAVGWGGIFETG